MVKRVLVFAGDDTSRLETALAEIDGLVSIATTDRAEAVAALADVDALVTVVQTWGADFAAALAGARLQWLQVLNAGFDPLLRWGPLPRGLSVTTIGGAGSGSIAEHALYLLLASLRRAAELFSRQQRREWAQAVGASIESLQDTRVAVLGAGPIGRKVAALVQACGGEPVAVARSARRDPLGFEVVALEELGATLERCRAVVVALPLTPTTDGLLDAAMLARLPRGAHVVNVSRGRIVDTDALVAALRSGALGGAALDVTDPEPPPAEHPLFTLPSVILTPHVAWAGAKRRRQREIDEVVVDNARRFASGEPLAHIADIEP